MTPLQSISTCLRKSFTFSGRASRSEFWWFQAFLLVAALSMVAFDFWILHIDLDWVGSPFLTATFLFRAITLPALMSAFSRRFHDIGLPGWPAALATAVSQVFPYLLPYSETGPAALEWLFLVLDLLLLAIALFPSRSFENPYGPNPNEVTP